MRQKSKLKRLPQITSVITCITFLAGLLLSCSNYAFADSEADEVVVAVPSSCTFELGGGGTYNVELDNSDSEVVTANDITVSCNDASGYAIYAIGFSDDSYGNTDLISTTNTDYNIKTDGTGNYGSSWKMKLAAVSNATIEGSYSSAWQNIPATYVKVASFNTNTTTGIITPSYQINVSATQIADTYTGKVKYTLVHPNNAAAPTMPLNPTACPAYSICYAPNASDIEGSMSSLGSVTGSATAGKQTEYMGLVYDYVAYEDTDGIASIDSTTTELELIAPNYKRSGYSFIGWSTDFEATNNSIIYGPNQTISVDSQNGGIDLSTNGLILYPVWIEKESSVTMQTFNSTNYSAYNSAPVGTVIALEDERDHDVYAVAKLADGKWWMIENLRLDNTSTLTTANTDNPLNSNGNVTLTIDYDNNTIANHLAASTDTWCFTQSANCHDQTIINTNNTNIGGQNSSGANLVPDNSWWANGYTKQWYSYGNYYNWYAATAGHGTYALNTNNISTTGSICPSNWRLPKGGDKDNVANNDFLALGIALTGATPADISTDDYPGYNGYLPEGKNANNAYRAYPNNFVYSGYWGGGGGQAYDLDSHYWSSTAKSGTYYEQAYTFGLGHSRVAPGADTSGYQQKSFGASIRCIAGS